MAALDRCSDVVAWLEKTADGKAKVRIRRATHGGRVAKSLLVAQLPGGRAVEVPKVAVFNKTDP